MIGFNKAGQHFNILKLRINSKDEVDPMLKMSQNPTSDFERCGIFLQRQFPTLKQRWSNVT